MAVDRFRAAFAREAVHRLSEQDLCRVHSLTLDGKVIACLIVFIEAGIAYTWKTAYDEAYAQFSPGTLLMIDVTVQHLDDPNIMATDSCAVPDHPVMSRLWTERKPIGTIVVGLTPEADRAARQAASQLHLYRETRNMARLLRNRVRGISGGRRPSAREPEGLPMPGLQNGLSDALALSHEHRPAPGEAAARQARAPPRRRSRIPCSPAYGRCRGNRARIFRAALSASASAESRSGRSRPLAVFDQAALVTQVEKELGHPPTTSRDDMRSSAAQPEA